jgi:hypothetical protein
MLIRRKNYLLATLKINIRGLSHEKADSKCCCGFNSYKPWYALAELDLSILPEDTVLAMSDPDFSDTTHRVPTYSLNSAQQSNFTVGSGRAYQ